MRVIGLHHVADFLKTIARPDQADALRSFVYELQYRQWDDADSLAGEFADVVSGKASFIIFRLAAGAVRVDTIAEFRTGVVVITAVTATKSERKTKQRRSNEEAA